jgi:Tol biopolymer transport system component
MRLEIATPATSVPLQFALSPDGRYIAFVASGDGPQRLWLRALDKTEAQPLPGTEGVDMPFWSADSRSIGFTATGKLKRIDIAGGPPQVLVPNTAVSLKGTWNANGIILFNASLGPLSRIAAWEGESVTVTRLDHPPRQVAHVNPEFLPDGRHFLFYALGAPDASGIYLGSLDGGEPKRLTAADTAAAYLAPGMIVFMRRTTLMAQHLDLKKGELIGDPLRIADPVASNNLLGFGGFSVSADGMLAYRSGAGSLEQLKWYDRTGKPVSVASDPDSAVMGPGRLSPDGRQVAITHTVQGNIWVMDLVRGGMMRLTSDPAPAAFSVWSPEGTRIVFASPKMGIANLYVKAATGAGTEELLLETPKSKVPQDWSSDGQFLLYAEDDPKTGSHLWALPMTGNDRKPIMVVKTPFEEPNGQFSPDGRWVAYDTNESGRFEVVVQAFPGLGGKWPVSTGGGIRPRWRPDGKELYFVAPDGKLMAASISPGATFAVGKPVALFRVMSAAAAAAALGAGLHQLDRQKYAVSRDNRFLINEPVDTSTTPPITLILSWKPKR